MNNLESRVADWTGDEQMTISILWVVRINGEEHGMLGMQ